MDRDSKVADSILNFFGLARKSSIGPLRGDRTIYKSLRELMAAQASPVDKPYQNSVWVYAAINAIATNISRVPFVIKRDIGAGLSKKLEDGPIYELFQNPNPLMSQRQLFEATMIFLSLRGEAIWVVERPNITVLPKEIWTFDPIRFIPVQNKQGMVTGWLYDPGTGKDEDKVPLANHEVIFFRYFNPYDDIRGLPPILAAQENINQDFYATRFNTAFFKNGARVDGYISIDGELTDDQFNRTLKQFEDRHQGYEKAHKIALIEGGGKYTQANVTQKDMDFIQGKQMTRQEILSAFNVNEVILGIHKEIKSYDGIKAADKQFWEECLMPKTHYIEDHLWAKFFSFLGQRRGRGKIWGEFDLATVGSLQVNFADKIETAHKMFTMGWPINSINRRLELGMEDVSWGDVWWVPGGYLTTEQILAGEGKKENEPVPPKKPGKEPKEPEKMIEEEDFDLLSISEQEFRTKIKKFVFEVRKKTLSSIYCDEFVRPNLKKEFDKLKSDLQKVYYTSIITPFLEMDSGKQRIDSSDEEVVVYVSDRIEILVEKFAELLEGLFNALEKANSDKEDNAEKVRLVFNSLTQKSILMAKNETMLSKNYGRKLFVKKSFGKSIEFVPKNGEEDDNG